MDHQPRGRLRGRERGLDRDPYGGVVSHPCVEELLHQLLPFLLGVY